jgi:hypothetical protein
VARTGALRHENGKGGVMSNASAVTMEMQVGLPERLTREGFERLTAEQAERLITLRFQRFSEQGLNWAEALKRAVRPD